MNSLLFGFDVFLHALRQAVLVIAIVVAVLALVDWLARTRRIGPFTPIARFSRRWLSPLFAPMDRVVVRAGGRPSNSPWWAVVAVAVGGLLLIALTQFLRGIAVEVSIGVDTPSELPRILINWAFEILKLALLIRVLSSWFAGLRYSRWIAWTYPLTEWMLAPLRRVIPTIGMIDVTPIAAYFLIIIVQGLVLSAFHR